MSEILKSQHVDYTMLEHAAGPVAALLAALVVSCWAFLYRTWDLRIHMILVILYAVAAMALWSVFAYLPYRTFCNITRVTLNTTIQYCYTQYIQNPYANYMWGLVVLLLIHAVWVVILWLYFGTRGLARGRVVIYE